MARKTAEDRAKSGSRLAVWTSITRKYKDLESYKPDITGSVKSYDGDVSKASDIAETKKKLTPDTFRVWSDDNESTAKQVRGHLDEAEGLHDKLIVDYKKMQSDLEAKPEKTIDILDDFDNRIESFIKARKALWDAVIKTDETHLNTQKKIVKQVRDMFSKFDKEEEALLAQCDKLEASLRKAISEFQKKAAGAGNDDLVDALDNFIAGF